MRETGCGDEVVHIPQMNIERDGRVLDHPDREQAAAREVGLQSDQHLRAVVVLRGKAGVCHVYRAGRAVLRPGRHGLHGRSRPGTEPVEWRFPRAWREPFPFVPLLSLLHHRILCFWSSGEACARRALQKNVVRSMFVAACGSTITQHGAGMCQLSSAKAASMSPSAKPSWVT